MKIRKIVSKKEEDKKKKRNQLIAGIVMIAVMFFSVAGYSFIGRNNSGGTTTKIVYKGIEFTKENNLWNAKIGDSKFSFHYNPNEVGKINSTLNLLEDYSGKPLYFSSNGAEIEITRNLFYQNQIVQRVQYACLEGKECIADYPIKTCADNFIIISESENAEIKQQGNCLFIQGKKEDLVKLTDSVLFKMIGIQ
jgi:hypothetical protein